MSRAARVLLCAGALGLLLALFHGDRPAPAAVGSVLVVGDSLSVGTTPYLKHELPGTAVTSDGRVGRPSTEAVGVLRSKLGGQRIVVFDAGVNDDPAQPSRLSSDLASVRSLVGGRCLVVATMSRPPYNGVTVDGLNRAVRSFAAATPTVRLVDWRAAAVANRRLINSDGVHPTAAGYALRARLFAQAIQSCSSSAAPPSTGGDQLPPITGATPPPPRRPRGTGGRKPPAPKRPRRPSPPKRPPPRLGSESPVVLDEPLPVASSGARLSGELLAPAGAGRHPAVVMIQGSGPALREQYREQGEYLAEHGVAAYIYDKRGAGQSTGSADYRYSQLAGDVRAIVAELRRRPDVAPDGIGLWGLSEGGWIAPMVAAGNPQIAAVMVVSAPGVSPASQRDWAARRSLDVAGAGTGDAAVSRYYAVAGDAGGLGADRAADLRFDPLPDWRRVAQPVLATWGDRDDIVPARASASAIGAALAAGGVNHDRSFRTFPGAAHTLGIASESYRTGSAPGFMQLSATWLRAHLGRHRAPAAVSTPLPPPVATPVRAVAAASVFERWPVQIAWLLLPALALVLLLWRAWRGRAERPPEWWWLGAVAALDVLALFTLAFAVVTLVGTSGQDVESVAGIPAVIVATWVVAIAAAVATGLLARRTWPQRKTPAAGVCVASAAWLLLVAYWLV